MSRCVAAVSDLRWLPDELLTEEEKEEMAGILLKPPRSKRLATDTAKLESVRYLWSVAMGRPAELEVTELNEM